MHAIFSHTAFRSSSSSGFRKAAWPSGIVSSEVLEPLRSFQPQRQSPVRPLFRNPMKALPLPSPKVLLLWDPIGTVGNSDSLTGRKGTSSPYIPPFMPCTLPARASRATPHGFPCVSPLLPREPTDPFWQFSLRPVSQPSPNVHRVGNSTLNYEATYRFASAATRRFARLPPGSLCQETLCFGLLPTPPPSYVGELPNSHGRTLTDKSYVIHGIRTLVQMQIWGDIIGEKA